MTHQTSYYLRLPRALSRELRHLCINTGATMNDVIVQAIRAYLDLELAAADDDDGRAP